jgi:succinate--hydroxymethylglutarate CoA-transferase
MIGAGNEKQFKNLTGILSRPSWVTDERFKSNTQRVANRDELIKLVKEELSEHTTKEWVERFTGKGVPFAPINNIQVTAHSSGLAVLSPGKNKSLTRNVSSDRAHLSIRKRWQERS